jgi:hypothetical protein
VTPSAYTFGIFIRLAATQPSNLRTQTTSAGWRIVKPCDIVSDTDESQSCALRQPGVPSMLDSLEVKVLYPT